MTNSYNNIDVACVGDAFVDTITYVTEFPKSGEGVWGTPVKLVGGGCGANVASGLAKTGAKVGFFGRVGDDENGNFLIKDFINRGVDISGVVRDPNVPSGVVFILVEPRGERTIIPCALGAAYTLVEYDDLKPLEENPPKAIFLSGVILGDEPSHTSIITLAKKVKGKTRLFFDPNLRHPSDSIPPKILSGMQELARISDVVLIGENEQNALKISPQENQLFIVKYGDKGAKIESKKGVVYFVEALKVEVVDAIGAGDTFAAAFMAAFLKGYSDIEALELANIAGGLGVTIQGARCMPAWEDVLALWKKKRK